MEEKIMISKDTSLIRDGVWVNGIKITTSEDWNRVVEESIPKQKIRDKIEEIQNEFKERTQDNDSFYYDYSNEYAHIEEVLKELLGDE